MLTVPNDLPLDAKMRDRERDARSKIERAKLVGGLRVTGHVERIRPGQAGYSIADEAELIRARAIVMGMRSRNGKPLYDDTVRTVLAERPCRVIVVSEGNGAAAEPIPSLPPV
jgi:APA family basic amino acid/polyamine antiporter